jgi:hypothetical protein
MGRSPPMREGNEDTALAEKVDLNLMFVKSAALVANSLRRKPSAMALMLRSMPVEELDVRMVAALRSNVRRRIGSPSGGGTTVHGQTGAADACGEDRQRYRYAQSQFDLLARDEDARGDSPLGRL